MDREGNHNVRIAFVMGQYPDEERTRRADIARSFAADGVDVDVLQVRTTPYVHRLTPTEIAKLEPYYIEAFKRAEAEGYDAAVPLGMLDLGVEGGRSAVDIPVVGPCEAVVRTATLLGDRLGLVGYHPHYIPFVTARMRARGLLDQVVGFRTSGFDLPEFTSHRDDVVRNVVASARALIDEDGADVIVPLGVSLCPVHISPGWLQEQLGVPVVEGIGTPIRLAATFAGLGLAHSRVRWPRSAGHPVP